MTIAPRAELLDDPRQQSGRRIVQSVSEGLRLGSLYPLVPGLEAAESVHVAEKHFFLGRQLRRVASFGGTNRKHVDIDAEDAVGVYFADSRRNRRPPVSPFHRV